MGGKNNNYVLAYCVTFSKPFTLHILDVRGDRKVPDALGKLLLILRKNLSPVRWDKCAWWYLDLPNFVKAYQTSETPSSCLRARQIFVRGGTVQILQFARHDLKKRFLSAPTIIKLKIWQRQILSRFWQDHTNFVSPLRPDPKMATVTINTLPPLLADFPLFSPFEILVTISFNPQD